MYIPLLHAGGGTYWGVDDSPFACAWIENVFYTHVCNMSVERFFDNCEIKFDCILAAHLLEHVDDAPWILKRCHDQCRERIYLIVPDDRDPVNPDHKWFFTKDSLIIALRRAGFKEVRYQIQKIVPQEDFIYCVAEA
jgi:hypothetical protein